MRVWFQGSERLHMKMKLCFLRIVGPRCTSPQVETLTGITLGEQNVSEDTIAATAFQYQSDYV